MAQFNNQSLQLTSHGGSIGVTGSCHELLINKTASFLVDCGLFQGAESKGKEEYWQIDFDIHPVKALLITHCHIDHVGRVPALLAAGFDGPIYCTKATALLLAVVIEDALKVAGVRNRSLVKAILARLQNQIVAVDYAKWVALDNFPDAVKIKFRPAGHIIGSAYIEVHITENKAVKNKLVFSGDLGAPYTPLLAPPKSPYRCDWLIMESTYGDKNHQNRSQRIKNLKRVVEKSLKDGGTILIPAFSIGRTQELLYELEEIIHKTKASNSQWKSLPIIVDSPLAAKFTKMYRQLKPLWDKEAKRKVKAGRHPLNFKNLIIIDSHQAHMALISRLVSTGEPAIIIAASGMCSGGRIVNYLKALLDKKQTDLLFVGYQAKGTPGREIQKYGPQGGYVILDGEKIDIRAKIHTLSGYSAHADQSDLVNFVKRMRYKPSKINLIHGNKPAKTSLANEIYKITDAEIEWE